MSDNPISRMGAARGAKGYPKGTSGNPGGQPSLKNDLERARIMGVPPEISKVLEEWRLEADERFAEFGAAGFVAGLQQALDAAMETSMPLTPADARAMHLRTTWKVFIAGPESAKDSVWVYTAGEWNIRLWGKPKEHVVVEDGNATPIDWSRVPEDRRGPLGDAIVELHGYLSEPDSKTEH